MAALPFCRASASLARSFSDEVDLTLSLETDRSMARCWLRKARLGS